MTDAVKQEQQRRPAYPCSHTTDNTLENVCTAWKSAKATARQADWSAYTFWLAAAGTFGVILTLRLNVIATRASKRSADAAKRSADILSAQEAPHLFFLIADRDVGYRQDASPTFPPVEGRFENYGRTPAIPRQHRVDLDVTPEPPTTHAGPRIDRLFVDAIPGGSCKPWTPQPARDLTFEDIPLIMTRQTTVWIWGWVVYDDVFGTEHLRHFLFEYDINLDRFVESGGRMRNYETSRAATRT